MLNNNFNQLLLQEKQLSDTIKNKLFKLKSVLERKYNKELTSDEFFIISSYEPFIKKEIKTINYINAEYTKLKEALDEADNLILNIINKNNIININ